MTNLEAIIAMLLITATVGPLLLLGVFVIADHFDLRLAPWLLDTTARALTLQWQVGGWVNLAAGLALAGLGVWFAVHDAPLPHRIGGFLILVAGGLWRAWRGSTIIRGRN